MPLAEQKNTTLNSLPASTNRCHGSALFEVLIALGIAAIVFSSLYPSYRFLLNYHIEQSARLRIESTISRTLNSIKYDETTANTISGFANIQIHPLGSFLTTSGQTTLLPNISASASPHPNSSSISFRHLDIKTTLAISEAKEVINGIELIGCSPHPSVASVKNWLAIAPTGYIQTEGTLRRLRVGSDNCTSAYTFKGTLRPKVDPVFADTISSTKHLAAPFLLVSIEQSYSLYVDSQKTLRRVSHNSLENQPLVLELGLIKTELLKSSPLAALFRISISNIASPSNRPIEQSIYLTARLDDPYTRLNMLR